MDRPVMVVTGTRTGIGRGIAGLFAARGCMVMGCSRGPASFDSEFYEHTQVDVGDEQQVAAWISSIRKRHERIDLLVASAGSAPADSLLMTTSAQVLEPLLRTNVCGTYYVCREAAKVMILRRTGRIVTLSSMAVGLHAEGTSAYSASKSAIVEMTKILAKELAPLGITCNVIAPSMIMTDAVRALGEEIIARALSRLTIKREVTIEEICNVITFFASPESGCITGQVLHMGLVC